MKASSPPGGRDLSVGGPVRGFALGKVPALAAAACICIAVAPAAAIVGGLDTAPSGEWAMDWGYVYQWRGASAVAVGDYWIITVAHLADDGGSADLTIGAELYRMQEIVFHESSTPGDDPADLALIRFNRRLPGHYDILTNMLALVGDPNAILIGYGTDGVLHPNYYEMTGGTQGTKRWGTNKVDAPFRTEEHTIGGTSFSSISFGMWYSQDDTEYESGYGWLDSGGGTFVHDGNDWVLAGINEVIYDNGNPGQYVKSCAVSIPWYHEWITSTVPEPAAPGDVNGDGNVDNLDITPFIDALNAADEAAFLAIRPDGAYWAADTNEDGNIDNLDITPFIGLVPGGGEATPEPAAMRWLGATALIWRRARRRRRGG